VAPPPRLPPQPPPAGRRQSPTAAHSRARVEKKEQASGKGTNGLGFRESRQRGFLTARNQRVPVDFDRTATIVPRASGLDSAQAGMGMRGPGPGCLGPSASVRTRGVRGGRGPGP
jgi:hypothetical protein